jgi:ferrous iron transport protein B
MVFFEENAGTLVFAMYVVSIALVVLGSALYRLFFFKEMKREPLLIELPPYRLPTTKFVFQDAWMRVRGFLQEAGGVVVGTVVVVWLLMSIPLGGGSFANTPVADSAYGRVSAAVAPVFAPAGFGDWHTTGALVTGFVAKEVVISSWAQNYSVDEPSDNFDSSDLAAALREDFTESSGGHPTSAVLAFLVFLAAYTPCVATVGAQRREFGWRWTGISLGVQTAFAWVLAVAVFQILKMIGIG